MLGGIFTRSELESQDLASPGSVDADCDYHYLIDNAVILPNFQIQSIQP
jgi:hypothetical protein